jgi:REP element-mobilizing transposase RayT
MRAEKVGRAGRSSLPALAIFPMDPIGRKHLPHDGGPLSAANPEGEVYFITICCLPRGQNQLAHPDIWQAIDETLTNRENSGALTCRLALSMPDHFHALMAFREPMKQAVSAFKSWLARQQGIRWQRDFFDHRLRGWESATEKATYIRMNPVRAGLVANPQDWPYQR